MTLFLKAVNVQWISLMGLIETIPMFIVCMSKEFK